MKNKSLEVLEKIVNLNSFNRKDLIELSSRQDVIELLDDILGSILSEDDIKTINDNKKIKYIIKNYIETKKELDELYNDCDSLELYVSENRNFDILQLYYAELDKCKIMTDEEQINLIRKAKNGDKEAEKEFISRNLRFVVKIVGSKKYKGVDKLDLIQEGNIGLINAYNHFDPEKGFKFSTYAMYWIKREIQFFVSKKSNMIRIPENKVYLIKKIQTLREEYYKLKGCIISDEELAKVLNIPENVIKECDRLSIINDIASVDKEIDDDEETLYNFISSEDEGFEIEFEDTIKPEELLQYINENLKKKNQKDVIIKRYGLDGNEPMTLKEIGKQYNLTSQRIQQIESSAIKNLSKNSKQLRKKID